MLRQASVNFTGNRAADGLFAASRQVWLAGLGAAAVSRDWAQHRAGDVFKALIKQGSAVESQAVRVIGTRIETSMKTAEALWNHARRATIDTLGNVAERAAAALPKPDRPVAKRAPATKSRKATRQTKAARRGTPRAKRSVRKGR